MSKNRCLSLYDHDRDAAATATAIILVVPEGAGVWHILHQQSHNAKGLKSAMRSWWVTPGRRPWSISTDLEVRLRSGPGY